MCNFARTVAVPMLLALTLLVGGCGPLASLEPIYTEKDLVFDPAALGVWYSRGVGAYVHVTAADDKTYHLVVIGEVDEGFGRELATFEAHLVKLRGYLFLDLFPDFKNDSYSRLSGWYGGNVRWVHQIALVKQLHPAPHIVFMDPDYLEEHPPAIRHVPLWGEDDDGILIAAPTKRIQRFLRKAVKRGAFDNDEETLKWSAGQATALHFTAARGDLKEIKQLIKKGTDTDARDELARTPLHWAAEFNQMESITTLTAAGANVNAKDENGETPLQLAALKGSAEVVALLLAKGADVNGKNEDGETPLHWGAFSGSVTVVEALLNKGGGVNAKDPHGRTPLHVAVERPRNSVHAVVFFDKTDLVSLLLTRGADVNAMDENGRTPLHAAVTLGSGEGPAAIVQQLLGGGAAVDIRDEGGKTPLDLATDPKVIELLKQQANKK